MMCRKHMLKILCVGSVILYNSIRDLDFSLFKIFVLNNLKSSFQSDHQVDISLYFLRSLYSNRLGN